jgi:hypothetical protein
MVKNRVGYWNTQIKTGGDPFAGVNPIQYREAQPAFFVTIVTR